MLEILELYTRKVCEMFVYNHLETIEYVKISLLFKKIQTLWVNNSRILTIKKVKFQSIVFILI